MKDTNHVSYDLPRRGTESALILTKIRNANIKKSLNYKGKVLVMDDEEIIRAILSVMLQAFGYEVHLTADGNEAIASYAQARESGSPFDSVIIDLNIVEGMGGKETIGRLLEIDPEVRAIVSSGRLNDHGMTNFTEYGFKAALRKPYTINELREVLAKVISEGGKPGGLEAPHYI